MDQPAGTNAVMNGNGYEFAWGHWAGLTNVDETKLQPKPAWTYGAAKESLVPTLGRPNGSLVVLSDSGSAFRVPWSGACKYVGKKFVGVTEDCNVMMSWKLRFRPRVPT